MSMLAKIAIFCAFIVIYGLWCFAVHKLTQRMLAAMVAQRGYAFYAAALNLIAVIGMFLFVWLLAGFLDFRFAGLLLAGQLLSLIIVGIAWPFLGNPEVRWGALIYWESAQMVLRHPWSPWVDMAVGLCVLIGFPIAAGWVYFANEAPSERLTLLVFQVTVGGLFLLGMISTIKSGVLLLSSPTLNEHARDRILVTQLAGFVSWGLSFSMVLWVFGIGREAGALGATIPLGVSPVVLALLLGFLLAVYVLPYVAGVQRRSATRRARARQTEALLQDAIETLKLPRSHSTRADELTRLQERITRLVNHIGAGAPLIAAADQLQSSVPHFKEAYEQARHQDSEIQSIESLNKLSLDLGAVKAMLADPVNDAALATALDNSAKVLEVRLQRARDDPESKEGSKLAVWLAAGAAAVVSPLLSELGKLLVERVKQSAAKVGALDRVFAWFA